MHHPPHQGRSPLSAILTTCSITVLAAPVLWAQDAEFAGIVKSQRHIQTGPTSVVLEDDAFVFDTFTDAAEADSLTSVTLSKPGGTELEVPIEDDGTEFFYDAFFESLNDLNTSFPNGAYSLTLVGVNDGEQTINLSLTGDAYPTAPRFTDYEDTQSIDHTQGMTFRWNPIAGGTADTWVFFEIEDSNEDLVFESPFPGEDGSLSGVSTSLTIPPNTLALGETYMARLAVVNVIDESDDYPGAEAIAGYQTMLSIEIQTNGPDNTAPNLVQAAPFWGEQFVTTNSIITFVFDEPMDQSVDPGDAITWTNVGDPDAFSYRWSPNGEILFCHYGPGLPTDNNITWFLNEQSSPAKLRDIAGNHLIHDTHQGEFLTDSASNSEDPDVLRIDLFKAKEFGQTGDSPVDLNSYFADFFVDFTGISTVSSVDLDIPGVGLAEDLGEFDNDFLSLEADQSFSSEADLHDTFPAGDYDLTLHTFHDGDRTVTLNPGSGEFPAAPTVLNFSTTQNWDSTQPFTVSWNPMPDGTSADAIFLFIEGEHDGFFETPDLGEPGALDGTATSVTIPANALPPGRTLDAELVFAKVNDNDTTQYPGVRSAGGLASITLFRIQTSGDPFVPQIALSKTSTRTRVKVTGERGQIFDVHASGNLIDWDFVGTVWLWDEENGFLSSGTLEDLSDPEADRRFYRIEDAVPE